MDTTKLSELLKFHFGEWAITFLTPDDLKVYNCYYECLDLEVTAHCTGLSEEQCLAHLENCTYVVRYLQKVKQELG